MTLYGIIASFPDADRLAYAARAMRKRGYCRMDGYSPYPVPDLAEILGIPKTRMPLVVLAGAVVGAAFAYGLILYSVEVDYPINVGGRPLHSWPAYIVIAFEAAILGAAIAGFIGVFVANGLPRYYHPVFNAPIFSFAEGGNFYLLVRADDPKFSKPATRAQLERLGAEQISEVEA
ncbi:Transmembrane prediction [Mesorhizobium plurifarium]|uniref:Transmembrane prediction n=1 Tax=Mesorhizobium plurifarium TaxID=69974 RepID=A0A090FXX5_MESPL|nr:Transmembrane prediction [Mesorhizobium plurifarium]